MIEKSVDRCFCAGLKKLGLRSIKLTSFGPRGEAGWPDRLVLGTGGVPVFVELKATGAKASPLQLMRQEVLTKLGFPCGTFDDAEKALAFVKDQVEHHVLMDYDPTPGGKRCRR